MISQRELDFKGIILNSFLLFFSFTIWRVLFNNYGKEVFEISAFEIGIIQAVREIPGLLGFGVGLLALKLAEIRITTISLSILGLGLIICGVADTILMLGIGTFVMSVGFHYCVTANQSILLHFIKGPESGRKQGVLSSWEAAAGVLGTGLVFLISLILGYREIFIIFGGLFVFVGIYLTFTFKSNRLDGEQRKFTMKKKYWLYYTISFLRGCRRHIFMTFAIFLLVANYNLQIEYTALLLLVTSAITIYTNKQMGNLVEIIGERLVLVISSIILVGIFCGYAFVTSLTFLIILFMFDHILFGSSVAVQSYIRKIASKEDLTNCVSFGLTSNHISAVIIPIVGGILWEEFGYRNTFLMGAGIVVLDIIFAMMLKPKKVQ